MAGGSKGRRAGAKKTEKAPKGGGAALPEGVTIKENGNTKVYLLESGGQRVEVTVDQIPGFNMASIDFTVGGSYDRGTMTGRDATRTALKVARIAQYEVSQRPDGYKYTAYAHSRDGYGAKRANAYEKFGFSKPDSGTQYAVVKNGKLKPATEAQFFAGT